MILRRLSRGFKLQSGWCVVEEGGFSGWDYKVRHHTTLLIGVFTPGFLIREVLRFRPLVYVKERFQERF